MNSNTFKITVFPSGKTVIAYKGERLLDVLARERFFVTALCGGNGTCGKCRVKIEMGALDGVTPDENGCVLSCHAFVKEDASVYLPSDDAGGLTEFDESELCGEKIGYGVALDIGTTTLAACLVELESGKTLKKVSALNPQSVYGADVLSRINACNEGKLGLLQALILEKTKELIGALADGRVITELCVSANTTMLHLFLGVDPKTIGVAPFTPVFTDEKVLKGEELGLPVKTVRVLPSASGYIGSDVTSGVSACGIDKQRTALFVDIGTNGEIVLAHNGHLYSASTAAGPAFEGACIECGIGGVAGAINSVSVENGEIVFTTIDGEEPRGICGSGLIDLIAVLRGEELIDESGALDDLSESPLSKKLSDDRFYLTDDIYLSQSDVRQFQLAKSAISAGIETLLAECGLDASEVDALYVAGGIGYYMDMDNALSLGLLPTALKGRIYAKGNTSLAGAKRCLLSEKECRHVAEIASSMEITELSFSKIFVEKYVENMMF